MQSKKRPGARLAADSSETGNTAGAIVSGGRTHAPGDNRPNAIRPNGKERTLPPKIGALLDEQLDFADTLPAGKVHTITLSERDFMLVFAPCRLINAQGTTLEYIREESEEEDRAALDRVKRGDLPRDGACVLQFAHNRFGREKSDE